MAVYSAIDVVNIALAKLRQPSISSFDADDTNARLMKNLYDIAVDHVMSLTYWPFARAFVELNQLDEDTDDTPNNWYAYQLPNDCAVPIGIEPITKTNNWLMIQDKIYTPASGDVWLYYLKKQTAATYFSIPFINVVSAYLASLACMAITGDLDIKKTMDRDYQIAKAESIATDANIGSEWPPQDSESTKDTFVNPTGTVVLRRAEVQSNT